MSAGEASTLMLEGGPLDGTEGGYLPPNFRNEADSINVPHESGSCIYTFAREESGEGGIVQVWEYNAEKTEEWHRDAVSVN